MCDLSEYLTSGLRTMYSEKIADAWHYDGECEHRPYSDLLNSRVYSHVKTFRRHDSCRYIHIYEVKLGDSRKLCDNHKLCRAMTNAKSVCGESTTSVIIVRKTDHTNGPSAVKEACYTMTVCNEHASELTFSSYYGEISDLLKIRLLHRYTKRQVSLSKQSGPYNVSHYPIDAINSADRVQQSNNWYNNPNLNPNFYVGTPLNPMNPCNNC